MKIGEIIRHIAAITDLATELEPGEEQGVYSPVPAQMEPVPDPAQRRDVEPNNDDENDEIMVPPLQQKHELLKKATGLENNTDQFAADDPSLDNDTSTPNSEYDIYDNDDVEELRKLAGIEADLPGAEYPEAALISVVSDTTPEDD